MTNFAVIKNGIVENMIVADSKEIAEEATKSECIDTTEKGFVIIGFSWDGENFSAPIIETPAEETPAE